MAENHSYVRCDQCGRYVEVTEMVAENADLRAQLEAEKVENDRLRKWVNDLQSGMYVNCVYCGHRYGPEDEVPASMADVLKAHIEQCPEHPMSELRAQLEATKNDMAAVKEFVKILGDPNTTAILYPDGMAVRLEILLADLPEILAAYEGSDQG